MNNLGFDTGHQIVSAVQSAESLCKITGQTCFVMARPTKKGESKMSCSLTVLTQEQMNSLRLPTTYVVRYCTG